MNKDIISLKNELFIKEGFRFIKVAHRGKNPIELKWTLYNNYSWNDTRLQEWIQAGGNVGVATGFGNLVVIDFDNVEFQDKFIDYFPKTLTQKSGTGKFHLFFITDNGRSFKIVNPKNKDDTWADIQNEGKQIIVSPSIHPNGNKYEFVNNLPIAFISFAEIEAIFEEYLHADRKSQIKTNTFNVTNIDKPSLRETLSRYGVDVSKRLTKCPWHLSNGGKCFSWDENKGWHCFHCEKGGDVISFVMENNGINFKEACEELKIKLPVINKSPLEQKQIIEDREKILLTRDLRNDPHQLAKLITPILASNERIFYRPYFDQLVEVFFIHNKEDIKKSTTRIRITNIDEERLKNLLLDKIYFYEETIVRGAIEEKSASLSKSLMSTLMKNDILLNGLRSLEKVMTSPFMYISDEGLIIEDAGYSETTGIIYTPETPKIREVNIQKAKEMLYHILSGFCFEDEEDKVMALAYIITPALRGLYSDKRERTPCFALLANRERAGKDYLAGVRGIIYTGINIDSPPIADGERANVEEWRKKFVSMMMNGETIFHSANNVGYLNNPFFEALITSKVMQDRVLGSNNQKQFDNWIDFSFSANAGLRWRGDMSGRLRRINLFYEEEDPNSRTYPIKQLHEYILENRGYILSCIFSLVKDWYSANMPFLDDQVFTSFPVWASYCGAIMQYHGLGNPLVKQEDDELSGNEDEKIMGAVYELGNRWQMNRDLTSVTSKDILEAIESYQSYNDNERLTFGLDGLDEESLQLINLTDRGGKVKMGILINKFKGRIMKGIRLTIVQKNKHARRRTYSFDLV